MYSFTILPNPVADQIPVYIPPGTLKMFTNLICWKQYLIMSKVYLIRCILLMMKNGIKQFLFHSGKNREEVEPPKRK